MRVKEYKNKIVLAELDPNCDYLIVANAGEVRYEDLQQALSAYPNRKFGILGVHDVDKAIRFVEVPKKDQ